MVMELMRHSDLRLSSTTYTDTTSLPLFDEVGKRRFDRRCPELEKREIGGEGGIRTSQRLEAKSLNSRGLS